ncbi:tetratricopeptide repeat protein [Acidimangrovimonas pyrenivorans]|uniref:Tetratricopeptide repeat protein n=1 Tax=Acidimangrovimonas pyrenivorans TaxID=2030798 RepID=A0ABV7AJH9_9RHOB
MILTRRLGLVPALTAGLSLSLAGMLPAAAQTDATQAAPVVIKEALTQGIAGPYLAARQASRHNDYAAAARYSGELLTRGVATPQMMETALQADIALGKVAAALPVAQQLRAKGIKSTAAMLVVLTDELAKGEYDKALADLKAGHGIGKLVDGLITAWADLGAGRMSEATAQFDEISTTAGLQGFGLYHKALALASVGDFEGADKILTGTDTARLQPTRRSIIAHAEVLSQLERNDDALKLLNAAFKPGSDPGIDALRDKLKAGETLPFDIVRTPRDGLAEVYYTVASALDGQAEAGYTLIYARLAEYLRPDMAAATLLAGKLLEAQGRHKLAIAAYDSVPKDNPNAYVAEMARADALYADGQQDAAVEVLKQLSKAYPKVLEVQVALGDLLRRQQEFEKAAAAYDAALALIGTPQPQDWGIFYMRGISNERIGNWKQAESDFRAALKLNPDQPQVLNYLGYALVERGEKLDEALSMIRKAVAKRPRDGYIVDSLAWALYKLGRYKEALPHMEKASQLMPVDPIVTDHLGDVYWAVGRKLEARFQWRRALSYGPEPKDAERIKRKLAEGLDAVRKQEGATALPAASNGG